MNKRTRLRSALEILCFVLLFSMLVGMIPLSAEDDIGAETEVPEDDGMIDVVKLVNDAPRGTWLYEEDVEVVRVKNVNIPSNVISNVEDVLTKYTTQDLYAGEYISKSSITDKKVNKVNKDLLKQEIRKSLTSYVVVTDYIIPNTGDDLSYYLQEIIDKNPKRTIYFPDGEYMIASPLMTSAGAGTSVDIQLSDGAVIKAHPNWKSNVKGVDALIALGAAEHVNDIVSIGSYYTLVGGTLDGNNRAKNGVSINSGRESVIRNICIKNCITGVMVEDGANNVSSDCDFEDITVIANPNDLRNTYGVYVIGYDNTFTNIRIYNTKTGFYSQGAGNFLKSIYVNNTAMGAAGNPLYKNSVGISGPVDNRYSQCYVENCATAYSISSSSLIWDCTAVWTDPNCVEQNVIKTSGIGLSLGGIRAYFTAGSAPKRFLTGVNANQNGMKVIEGCIFDSSMLSQEEINRYSGYLKTNVIKPVS